MVFAGSYDDASDPAEARASIKTTDDETAASPDINIFLMKLSSKNI
jgi:hypothetical protein